MMSKLIAITESRLAWVSLQSQVHILSYPLDDGMVASAKHNPTKTLGNTSR